MILFVLLFASIPFILPIVSLVRLHGLRSKVLDLEAASQAQQQAIDVLQRRLTALKQERAAEAAPTPPAAAPAPPPRPIAPPPPSPVVTPPVVASPPSPPPVPPRPQVPSTVPPPRVERPDIVVPPVAAASSRASVFAAFDWEQLIGVKLFSAIAGIALVLAGIFFLRYSLDRGWLAPPVRVAIGIIVSTTLLVVCERRAARRYKVTADALDAAAIAILFSTFFAAHALWNLIPAAVTFGLLALVTALAVLLSIRHDSMFIALLGLVGGFATPALLSTGENRPIPLFTYLLLLNVGLAWVAFKKKWPVLAVLTLVLTTLYQWGWVGTYLSSSQLPLAMGIFLLFSITSFVSAVLCRRTGASGGMELTLERSGLVASMMPLAFAVFLAAVPRYGANAGLLFGFLLIIVIGLFAVALGQRDERLHAIGGTASMLVFAIWLATSYSATAWRTAVAFAVVLALFFALAPLVADVLRRSFSGIGQRVAYTAPALLFVFPAILRIEPATAAPLLPFGALFLVLAVVAWRALATSEFGLYLVAAFFAVAAEASWSATHFEPRRLGAALTLYAAFAVFYLGVPIAWRRSGRPMEPQWGGGVVMLAGLVLLVFIASGPRATAALWGLALLLAILEAGLFIESASGAMPLLSVAGGLLSWLVLAIWWDNAAAVVGLLPSLLVLVGLTLVMLGGHAWAYHAGGYTGVPQSLQTLGFRHGVFLALVGQFFLMFVAQGTRWSVPPWPLFGALVVMTLATSVASLSVSKPALHAGGVMAAAVVAAVFAGNAPSGWSLTALLAAEAIVAYGLAHLLLVRRQPTRPAAEAVGLACALFITEFALVAAAWSPDGAPILAVTLAHVVNLSILLWLAWARRWQYVAQAGVVPAWLATLSWQESHAAADWRSAMALATALYAVFIAYPFVVRRQARDSREPYLTAILGSAFYLFAARSALQAGGLGSFIGIVPVAEGILLALVLRDLLRIQPEGERDLGRLALVAGAALAFATVAIPLQLKQQWITIGWALEGAALSWLYRRIPHRGLLYSAVALLVVSFVRLGLNPAVFVYEPRGPIRIFNWYLYSYSTAAAAMFAAAWWLSATDDRLVDRVPRPRTFLPAGGTILLFLLLNIEVADFYATGPEITFRFGVTLAQDLTYTIGWLVFGLALLTVGIYFHNRAARITAVGLIAVTTFKAFLYDLGSLGGLYRVASFVGLAISLALVALALQKFVLMTPKESS